MSRIVLPSVMVGNDFMLPTPVLSAAEPAVTPQIVYRAAAAKKPAKKSSEKSAKAVGSVALSTNENETPQPKPSLFKRLVELMHRYSLGAFALLFLLVGCAGVYVWSSYASSNINLAPTNKSALKVPAIPERGPNAVVASGELANTLQRISSQPLALTAGTKNIAITPDAIKSWFQVVPDKTKGVAYIHVKNSAIAKTLNDLTSPLAKTPVNQVTVTRADGSSRAIVGGRDGMKVGDTGELAKQISQNVLAAKGIQLNLPMETVPFQSVTPSVFDKLLEVDVNTKQMWAYDKGQLTRQFAVSAGAPETPTPIGQYKIYSKYAIQDMKGLNPNGTKYFQPDVRWINYFLPGGYAVHGNYWRPQSWFGAINSSHGCVSLPEDQAKWVYDWAPIGTTVITHYLGKGS